MNFVTGIVGASARMNLRSCKVRLCRSSRRARAAAIGRFYVYDCEVELKIDRKNREVTLRGPTQTQEFDAAAASLLDGLRVGDTVRAELVSAVAASVVRVRIAPQ